MIDFFKSLTVHKVLYTLLGGIGFFFLSIRGMYVFQQVTNSSRFLQRAFGAYHEDVAFMQDTGTNVMIHTVGDSSKTPLVVIGGAGGGVYGWRHLMKQPGFMNEYQLLLVNQSRNPQLPNAQFLEAIDQYVRDYLDQTGGRTPLLLAKGGGTYTALHLIDANPDLFEKAILVSGYFNTMVDKTTSTEIQYLDILSPVLSPNFKKAQQEKLAIESDLNLFLQDRRVEESLQTPLVLVHGKYDLGQTSSHALFLQEALGKELVTTELTETNQLSLRKHSDLLVEVLNKESE